MLSDDSPVLLRGARWGSIEGGALVPKPFGRVSSPSPPRSLSGSAYFPSPPRDGSTTSVRQSATQRDRPESRTNPSGLTSSIIVRRHRALGPPKTHNHNLNSDFKGAGHPSATAPSLFNNGASRRRRPTSPLADRGYAWGSVAEHAFPSPTVNHQLSFAAINSTSSGGPSASTTSDALGQHAPVNPQGYSHDSWPHLASSASPHFSHEIEYAPGARELPRFFASELSSILRTGHLADDGAHSSRTATVPRIQLTPPSESIGTNDITVVDEDLFPAYPPQPATPKMSLETRHADDIQGVLTSASAQQHAAPVSLASLPTGVTGSQSNKAELSEGESEQTATVKDVSEADLWVEHWHEGVWGEDGYIYQLPPPILGYRPASHLHDQPWRGSQQYSLL
ncbi:hypothetical protein FKP32DRAFT_1682968 [Trametes sanguinea]|nr:hypothetical protein FKP32DRAFT_1682968 [Trametes sanguinea]